MDVDRSQLKSLRMMCLTSCGLVIGGFELIHVDVRLSVILMFWITMLVTMTLMTRDTVKKKRSYHFILISFVFFFLVASSMLYRLLFFSERVVTLIFYSIGLCFLWTHFELMRARYVKVWKLMIMISLTTVIITSFAMLTLGGIHPLALNLSVFAVTVLSIPSLLYPVFMSIKEYRTYRIPQQLFEILGFLLLLLSFQYFFLFEQIPHPFATEIDVVTIIIGFVGALLLMLAYLYNPAYMHRIPFQMYYLLGYHDSGILFFVRRIRSEHLDEHHEDPNLYLLSGILSSIDTAYRHILQQEIEHSVQKARNMELLFHRDPEKRISYVLIAEQVSWYLERSLSLLLRLTPKELITQASGEMRVVDQGEIDRVIEPLVRQIFPFFNMFEVLELRNH